MGIDDKPPGIWLPTVRAGTGADMFTIRLAEGLQRRGVRAEITWLPHRAEYAPWSVAAKKPPSWASVVHINTWLHPRFYAGTGLPILATCHGCVHDPARPARPGIGDTSDPNWSPEMQAAWPHFIMGVSQLWLELIREIDKRGKWPKEPLARYAAIEGALNEHWRSEGGHALLHHLSAVFGYRELLVTRREAMQF